MISLSRSPVCGIRGGGRESAMCFTTCCSAATTANCGRAMSASRTATPSRPVARGGKLPRSVGLRRWPGQLAFFSVLLAGIALWGYLEQLSPPGAEALLVAATARPADAPSSGKDSPPRFSCMGKLYCNQMKSCAEAGFYLRNCSGTKWMVITTVSPASVSGAVDVEQEAEGLCGDPLANHVEITGGRCG